MIPANLVLACSSGAAVEYCSRDLRFASHTEQTHQLMTSQSSTPDYRSVCPIACSLDELGDKWTLLIVRDIMNGKCRFADFGTSPERIPTNTLSDRLRRMEANDMIDKVQYAWHPPRFEY